jgi:palmitoyltransferase
MQLARLGEVAAVQKLFETRKFSPIYKDEEGITPLHVCYPVLHHSDPGLSLCCSLERFSDAFGVFNDYQWAAINNRYAMCKFLLDSGADVNAKGGESLATPVMWAAQRCYYYVVNLLLQHGADPLLTDVGGYNILHLATMDGNAFLLVLLLQQGIPVDATDPHGHTGLMWAAYRGFPACVDLFLRWGANVNASDEGGLTPLHWALVDGSHPCIQKVIEYGADRFAKTSDGKSPATVAGEMKTTRVWHLALNDCGYDSEGNTKTLPFGFMAFLRNQNIVSKFFLFWPFLVIFVATWILSHVVIFAAVPLFVVAVFALQWVAQQVANNGPIKFRMLQKTVCVTPDNISLSIMLTGCWPISAVSSRHIWRVSVLGGSQIPNKTTAWYDPKL